LAQIDLTASGVAGIDMASPPASATRPRRIGRFTRRTGFGQDRLPDAEFSLLPPKPNEPALIGEVRRLLVAQFA
jgi:hypothetical protein